MSSLDEFSLVNYNGWSLSWHVLHLCFSGKVKGQSVYSTWRIIRLHQCLLFKGKTLVLTLMFRFLGNMVWFDESVLFTGVPWEPWVHRYPESSPKHCTGLLEDDLGSQRTDHSFPARYTECCESHTHTNTSILLHTSVCNNWGLSFLTVTEQRRRVCVLAHKRSANQLWDLHCDLQRWGQTVPV